MVVPSIELTTHASGTGDHPVDTIADNASSCGWILGEQRVAMTDIDVGDIDATLTRNGEVVAKGNSSAVIG